MERPNITNTQVATTGGKASSCACYDGISDLPGLSSTRGELMSPDLPVVRRGSFCSRPGALGVTVNKTLMVCDRSTDGRLHWQGKDPTPPPCGRVPRRGAFPTPPAAGQPLLFAPVIDITSSGEPLNDDDRALLEFEARGWPSPGAKESAILQTFHMSSVRYYQKINRLIDLPAAYVAFPQMLSRLRRLRDRKTRRGVPA
jgi:Protein of unknown function (DUF3263)